MKIFYNGIFTIRLSIPHMVKVLKRLLNGEDFHQTLFREM